MTENIQNMITNTKNISDEMVKHAQNSLEVVKEGQQSMKELLEQADFIEKSNHQVNEANDIGSTGNEEKITAASLQTVHNSQYASVAVRKWNGYFNNISSKSSVAAIGIQQPKLS